ncbi:Uncharacterised protein [Mycobacteroides abscessus subsp. abscessus]|jgi:hypothetical protein|nr:Uncharacterised protein [Mycobacteroides abscessus subsp. abscessus]SHT34116.1 Uncharacterised protein [Mycobacteroides abscessus subsp. abscessus]SHU44116.1 Uncharacterised protein [Mycobacteroides abscessus subsp. abscessus]SHU59613.1 Uncharacterised protein [Mycobacteroides abscessus subsp. abscessus]SHV88387.1 Uncharacterised protein [Mycobacteroides abscessus subsp. abscessus]
MNRQNYDELHPNKIAKLNAHIVIPSQLWSTRINFAY